MSGTVKVELTPEKLAELRRLAEAAKAVKGYKKWRARLNHAPYYIVEFDGKDGMESTADIEADYARFIALANPETMLALLDRIAELPEAQNSWAGYARALMKERRELEADRDHWKRLYSIGLEDRKDVTKAIVDRDARWAEFEKWARKRRDRSDGTLTGADVWDVLIDRITKVNKIAALEAEV